MKTICPAGPVVMGCDVSHWQPKVNWNKVKAYGVEFVFVKASQYTKDPMFDSHWAGAKGVGLLRGAYHFFTPEIDPIVQAKLFVASIGALDASDMVCIDWEVTDSVPTASDRTNGLAFLQTVNSLVKKTPIIYTGPYFFEALAPSPSFSSYPLWVAHYGVKCPLIPFPFNGWAFWQKTNTGKIDGIGACDVDVFNGTSETLASFAASLNG